MLSNHIQSNSIRMDCLDLDIERVRSMFHQLADAARENILAEFGSIVDSVQKRDRSPVSLVDLRNNQLVIDAVKSTFPGHRVIGEEDQLSHDSHFAWVVDPIDGTCPFIFGIPTAVFSLALTYHGAPVIAIIDDPFHGGRRFYAEVDRPTTVNNQLCRVSNQADLEMASICWDDYQLAPFRLDPTLRDHLREEVRAYCWQFFSIAYAATRIAHGAFAAAVFTGKNPWDVAAAKLIVEQAGGTVTSLSGRAQRYDGEIEGCILSNGAVHERMVSMLSGRYERRRDTLTS